MTNKSTVNPKDIRSIVTTPTAETLMLALSLRERDREVTDLRRFRNSLVKDGTRIDNSEYYKFFRDLEAKGAGRLKVGSRGNPARFVWSTSMKQVGVYGISTANKSVKPEQPPVSTVKERVIQKTVAFFQVRGTSVRIELPGDVSDAQLKEISDALNKI